MTTTKETLEFCPVCNGVNFSTYIIDAYPINKCLNCSVLFVNPRPSEASIKQMFSDEYIISNSRVEDAFINYRKESLLREASLVTKLLPNGGSLLDLGTASGEFLLNFNKFKNWVVKGVEPSKYAADYARKNTKAKIYTGFLEDFDFPSKEFDLITSLDAFYFHSNPNKDLKIINKILKKDGFLMIEIPNLKFRLFKNTGVIAKIIYKKNSKLNAGVHLFYYNNKSLSYLLEKNGFKLHSSQPEQSPTYGNKLILVLNNAYYLTARLLYSLTRGKINISPKEVYVFQKTREINYK